MEPTQARIHQLVRDGYVVMQPTGHGTGNWFLTDLGWRTLSAAADPRPPPITQSKNEIECELRKWERSLLLVSWPISAI